MLEDLYAMPFFLRRHRTGLFGRTWTTWPSHSWPGAMPRIRFAACFAGCVSSASGWLRAATHSTVDAHRDPRISGPPGARVGRSSRTEKSEGPSHHLGPSVVDPERGLQTR